MIGTVRSGSKKLASTKRWLDAWEAEARGRGLDARGHEFWDPAYDWIMERARSGIVG
jgi:hypothetical protein